MSQHAMQKTTPSPSPAQAPESTRQPARRLRRRYFPAPRVWDPVDPDDPAACRAAVRNWTLEEAA